MVNLSLKLKYFDIQYVVGLSICSLALKLTNVADNYAILKLLCDSNERPGFKAHSCVVYRINSYILSMILRSCDLILLRKECSTPC